MNLEVSNTHFVRKIPLKRKLIFGFVGFFIILCGFFVLLFSPFGNACVRDFLLFKLESQTNFEWQARHFKLTPSQITLEAVAHNGQLELFLQSEYSLFLRNLKGSFLLNSKGFHTTFANKSFKIGDNVWIEGVFSGEFANYILQAQSNLLESQSDFNLYGSYGEIQSFNLHTKGASLYALFDFLNQAPYGDGLLDFDLKLSKTRDSLNATSPSFLSSLLGETSENTNLYNGSFSINLEGGELDAQKILEHFGIAIPPTRFMGALHGEITQNTLQHYLEMYSSVGDFTLKGASNLITLATNTEFRLNLQNLSPLSPFFGIPLNGALGAQGIAKGDAKNMLLNGTMHLEHSPLEFRLSLQNLAANTLKITSQNLESSALFTFLNQPAFLQGILMLDLDLRDFQHGISGFISMQSKDLLINSPLIEMHTQVGFPAMAFQLDSKVELAQGKGILNYALTSSLASFQGQGGKISLQPFSFEIPQEINLKRLQNFSYRNKSLLKGNLNAQGIATNEIFDIQGTITKETAQNSERTNPKSPTKDLDKIHNANDSFSFSIDKKGLKLHLDALTSAQIYTIFPKIPHYFEGMANLKMYEDFIDKTHQVHLDILQARFHNTPLLKALNHATKQNLAPLIFQGFFDHFLDNETLSSKISLQSQKDSKTQKSQSLQIQSSNIVTNLNNFTLKGDLLLKRPKSTKNHRLYGNIYQPKLQ